MESTKAYRFLGSKMKEHRQLSCTERRGSWATPHVFASYQTQKHLLPAARVSGRKNDFREYLRLSTQTSHAQIALNYTGK